MYREHTVGVVVPAYNEAGFVGEVIETLPSFVDRIYAVDDCSTDGTWAEIQRTAGVEPGSATAVGTAADGSEDATAARSTGDLQADSGTHASTGGRPSGASARDEVADDAAAPAEGDVAAPGSDDADSDDVDPGADDAEPLTDGAGAPRSERLRSDDGSPAESADDGESAASSSSASDRGAAGDGSDGGQVGGDAASGGRAGASDGPHVIPIRHEENRGVGGAIKTGYQRARADGVDVAVVVGGDGQMDPDVMERLLDPIVEGKADYAKGNRLLDPDHHEDMPRHRLVGNGVLTLLTKIATGYWQVGDPQMGYTAISREAMEPAVVDDMYEYYGYCNDLLVRLSTEGYRVADVPCPLDYGDEQSHITYHEYVPRVSSMLLGSFLRRLWADRGSASGAARLALFVGGALAVAAGVVGSVIAGLRRVARSDASTVPVEESDAPGDVGDVDATGADGGDRSTADDPAGTVDEIETAADASAAADVDAGRAASPSPADDGCRSTTAFLGGVASLLAAMLIDATVNATKNYTDRLEEDDRD